MKKLVFLVILIVSALPEVAAAQDTITVLGLRSATADEPMAVRITDALRQAAEAATSSRLTHSGRENELNQLLIVFDCEEPTEDCMSQIGESLNSQRLVFGLVEPESGRANADYAVALSFFNVETGRVERTLREVIPRDMNAHDMIEPVAMYYSAITGSVVTGELAIRCNVEGARVLVGGDAVGTTTAAPLVLRNLDPGEVSVVVEHDEYTTFRETITVEAGQLAEFEVTLSQIEQDGGTDVPDPDEVDTTPPPTPLPPPGGRRSLAWLGWTFGGLALASVGVGVWQGMSVLSAESDIESDLNNWGEGVDICAAAADGESPSNQADDPATFTGAEVADLCDSASTSQIMQFVFYGVGAALGAVAIWILVREYTRDDSDEEANRSRLSVAPFVFDGGAALSASLTF